MTDLIVPAGLAGYSAALDLKRQKRGWNVRGRGE